MRRYVVRLAVIAVLIVGTGVAVHLLGYSWRAAVLGMLLVTALSFAPTLLALEGISRVRHPDEFHPVTTRAQREAIRYGGQVEPERSVRPPLRPGEKA